MNSLKDLIKNDLTRLGIKSTTKEKCDICNYGYKVTIEKDNGETVSSCKHCDDKELIKELGIPETKEGRDKLRLKARANTFNRIPTDLTDVKLNNYNAVTNEQIKAKNEAVDFITNFDKERSLVLSGSPGVGKSHIAVAIANALKKDYSVLFLKSNDILTLIQESYNNASHSEKDILDACKDVDLLVIDDLGAEYSKASDSESWASTKLFSVLDSRLGKSVIVTTNYSETQLVEKFGMNGKRIVSRMNDNAELIRIKGEDGRRKQ